MIRAFLVLLLCMGSWASILAREHQASEAELEYNKASQAWNLELARFLAESEQPMVRILASYYLDTRSWKNSDLVGEGREIRTSALNDGWTDPAVVLSTYAANCKPTPIQPPCDANTLRSQLMSIDPGNAAVDLLHWLFPPNGRHSAPELNNENVALLKIAASKQKFELYVTAGVFEAFQAIESYAILHEQPKIPNEVIEEWKIKLEEPNLRLPGSHTILHPSVGLLTSAFAINSAAFSPLVEFCKLAKSTDDDEAIQGCLDLSDLMQRSSKTILNKDIGYAIRKIIERPGYSGAAAETLDPERWRDQVNSLVFQCMHPKQLFSVKGPEMPATHLKEFFYDLQYSGEIVAYKNAAVREFEKHPELYRVNPSECVRITELEEDVLREVVDLQRKERIDVLSEFLDQQ